MARSSKRQSVRTLGILGIPLGVCAALALAWWLLFSLTPYAMSDVQMREAYEYAMPDPLDIATERMSDRSWMFSYRSFDGSRVNGRIHYPRPPELAGETFAVMIGVHAMGRSEARWWQDSINDRPTIEQTHHLSQLALQHGYAVITIDARLHGSRKDPERPLRSIMRDLRFFGARAGYEQMIRDTVRDHRVLLDWLETNPRLDRSRIHVAGYSMGGQIALLLAGLDERVGAVLAIAPPHIGNGTALVAPTNVIAGLDGRLVWMLSGDNDEHASRAENAAFFESIPGNSKRHLIYQGGHILPDGYVADLAEWFRSPPDGQAATLDAPSRACPCCQVSGSPTAC